MNVHSGDSGGAILFPDKYSKSGKSPQLDELYGITSRGPDCSKPYHIGVYINVMQLWPWINTTIEVSINSHCVNG